MNTINHLTQPKKNTLGKIGFLCGNLVMVIWLNLNTTIWGSFNHMDTQEKVNLVILVGQSNMVGQGSKSQVENKELPKNVMLLEYGKKGLSNLNFNHFGPELNMAQTLTEQYPNEKFIFLKYAVSGSSLYNWSPNYEEDLADKIGNKEMGALFEKLVEKINFVKTHQSIRFWGVCMMQGERDARFQFAADQYAQNLTNFIQTLRSKVGISNLPFIIGRVNPPQIKFPFASVVRAAQENIAKNLSNVTIINTDDLEKRADLVHYNSSAQLKLGKRMAKALHQYIESPVLSLR